MAMDHLTALPTGFMLQEYRIEEILGVGGFGITYLATDTNLDKSVAIKEYMPAEVAVRQGETSVRAKSTADEADYEWGLDRFVQEAQTLARFQHPSIVPVHRFFKAHGTAYMVMEYQEGESLAERLKREDGLDERDLRAILFPLLDGLEEVHRTGVLHRDIKPGNIYIRRDGTPVLLDFGAARQAIGQRSKSLTAIVTAGYAPLEQYSSESEQGPYTDIYALAAVCYRCVTGEVPPDATSRVKRDRFESSAVKAQRHYDPDFLAAIDRALAVDEEERPQTVDEWRRMLRGDIGAGGEDRTVVRPGSPERHLAGGGEGGRRSAGMGVALWIIIGFAVTAVAGGIGFYAYQNYQEKIALELKLEEERMAAEERRKAEEIRLAEARRKAEVRRKAEAETKRKAEAEAKRKAEAEAKRVAEAAKRVKTTTTGTYAGSKIKSKWCVRGSARLRDVRIKSGSPNTRGSFSNRTCRDFDFLVSNVRKSGARLRWTIPFDKAEVYCDCARPGQTAPKKTRTAKLPPSSTYKGDKVKRSWCVAGSTRMIRRAVESSSPHKPSSLTNKTCADGDFFVSDLRVAGGNLRWTIPFTGAKVFCGCKRAALGKAARAPTKRKVVPSKSYTGKKIKAAWCVAGSQRLTSKKVASSSQFKPADFGNADCKNLNFIVRDLSKSGSKLKWTVGFTDATIKCSCTAK